MNYAGGAITLDLVATIRFLKSLISKKDDKSKLVAALVGTGAAANNLYLPLCCYTKVKFIFSSSGRNIKYANYFGSEVISDYHRILSDPEISFIVMANQSNKHFEFTKMALKMGKNVLVEKPVVLNMEQAEQIKRLAEEKNLIVGGIFPFRFLDVYRYTRLLIEKQALGKIISINATLAWARDKKYYERHGNLQVEGGGVMMVQAIHIIDLMLELGGEIKKSFMIKDTLKHNITVEDTSSCAISFSNGALGTIFATTAAHSSRPFEIDVIGTKGRVIFNSANRFLLWSVLSKKPIFIRKDLMALQVKNFVETVKGHGELVVDFTSAAEVIKTILEIYKGAI